MNSKSIALAITFGAIAIALNIIRIPTVYWPDFSYQVHEIPIVVAFLLFGPKIGVLVGVLNLAGQLTLFHAGPGGLIAYPMGLVATLLMLFGVYLANKVIAHKTASEKSLNRKKPIIWLTGFAIAVRGGIMPLMDYGVLYHFLIPLVLGVRVPEAIITALVPSFVLYNMTVPLYTIPVAYFLATRVSKFLKMEPRLLE